MDAYEFSRRWHTNYLSSDWLRWLKPWLVANQPMRVLEIGAFDGDSTCWWLQHAMFHPWSHLYVVDPFLEDPETWCREPVKFPGSEERYHRNTARTGKLAHLTTYKNTSDVVLPKLHEDFDVIYVDGDHTEEGVAFDTEHALRLVAPGGLILWDNYGPPGHDFHWPSVTRGVDRVLGARRPRMIGLTAAWSEDADTLNRLAAKAAQQ